MTETVTDRFADHLVSILREAQRIGRSNKKEGEASPELRAAQFAMHNVVKTLLQHPALADTPELCAPLLRISTSLFDLNHGRKPSLFSPVKRQGNNHGQPAADAMAKGTAARALRELVAGEMDEREAAQMVASALRSAKRLRATAETVINWRERMNQGAGPGAPEAALLAYKREPGPPGDTPLSRGLNLVEDLRKYAATIV